MQSNVDADLRAVAAAWLDKASGDLAAAETCAAAPHLPAWVVGFHCQQAAEKSLKGLLVLHGVRPSRSHDLQLLADLLADAGTATPLTVEASAGLMRFAVADRYPILALPEALHADLAALLVAARTAVAALSERLG